MRMFVCVCFFYVDDPFALCKRCGKMEEKHVKKQTILKTLLHIYAQQQG